MDVLKPERGAKTTAVLLAIGLASCARATSSAPVTEPLHVAAAADLTFAFDTISRDFTNATGRKVTVSYGASGLLAKQIENGAPFDVFASASPEFVDSLVRGGHCDGATKHVYAYGHLALVTRTGTDAAARIEDLASDKWKRVTIANPAHAPYGLAAKEALQGAGLWDSIQPRLVLGENVQQAFSYVETGNANVALVALSLASHVSHGEQVTAITSGYHPIAQALVVCSHEHASADPDAKRFADYILSEAGQKTLALHKFGPAGVP